MKLFKCQACGQVLLFENTRCEKCARRLGYLPQANLLTVVEPSGQDWTPYGNGERAYRFCLKRRLRLLQLAHPRRFSRSRLRRLPP